MSKDVSKPNQKKEKAVKLSEDARMRLMLNNKMKEMETEFDINFDFGEECIIKTFMDGVLTVKRNKRLLQDASHKYYLYSLYNNQFNQIDITNDLLDLFSMKKTDGCFFYKPIINNKQYFMTLFPGLLPLNKADKVFLSIKDFGNHFISFFTVEKKKYKVQVIVCYLKV